MREKSAFSLSYDVTNLHHISLVEFEINRKKMTDVFCLKTDSKYSCTNNEKRISWGTQLNKQQFL